MSLLLWDIILSMAKIIFGKCQYYCVICIHRSIAFEFIAGLRGILQTCELIVSIIKLHIIDTKAKKKIVVFRYPDLPYFFAPTLTFFFTLWGHIYYELL